MKRRAVLPVAQFAALFFGGLYAGFLVCVLFIEIALGGFGPEVYVHVQQVKHSNLNLLAIGTLMAVRDRWVAAHALRTGLAVAALVCQILVVLTRGVRRPTPPGRPQGMGAPPAGSRPDSAAASPRRRGSGAARRSPRFR